MTSTSFSSTSTMTSSSSTSSTESDNTGVWPLECGPPCRCMYWKHSSKLRFSTIEKRQQRAEAQGHVFFTYNVANRKCATSDTCFYNTKTARPASRWYQNSLQWRAHKSPNSQGRGIRLSSSEFITPDPDFTDEAEEDDGESPGAFEFEESLELSAGHSGYRCSDS